MRDVEVPEWLKRLPLAPEFRPTDTEFADPIAYISKIEKEASAFGICKVIPPLPKPSKKYVVSNLNRSLLKNPELGCDVHLKTDEDNGNNGSGEIRAVFTTRHQELGQSEKKRMKGATGSQTFGAHKQVWQSGEVYTLEQFEAKSKNFARSQLGLVKEISPLVVEAMFWEAASEKPIYIEYANDVPGSGFGEPEGLFRYFHRNRRRRKRRTFDRNHKGIYHYCGQKDTVNNAGVSMSDRMDASSSRTEVTSRDLASELCQASSLSRKKDSNDGNEMVGSAGWKLSNSPWNLQVIARSPGSLTRFMPDDIPGVTSPMIYIGMLFSWFAWHVEDHELHSLNFLHMGSPKTWYAIPGDYAFTFEEAIRHHAYDGNTDRVAALSLLGEKTTLLSPEVIVSSGIPCCRLVQNPGEFVVTFPRAYHVGFSHGFNCGEAANFATPKWLTVAREAAIRRAAMNYLPMLSHQQLLYLLTMSFVARVPRSLLPGVRSSRLRDRQKEEREVLVKMAFVEDVLKENSLLTSLLEKNLSYHVVLWDLDLLPSSDKDSELGNSGNAFETSSKENHHPENDKNEDLLSQMSSYIETLNDFYSDDDELTCDFQVDSGTLPCVACGILGFPFMAVVQPSEAAAKSLFPHGNLMIHDFGALMPAECRSLKEHNGMVEASVPDKINATENELSSFAGTSQLTLPTMESQSQVPGCCPPAKDIAASSKLIPRKEQKFSSGFFKPRIFCLEHAIQAEELLHSRGGANVLVICHSDFRKIKAHGAIIAEQVGISFPYNEIPLDKASEEDLSLIDLAIEDENQDECAEDWTTLLSINLRRCMKLRKNFASKKVQYALTLGGLFPDGSPRLGSLILEWQTRKIRSRRNSNNPVQCIPSKNIPIERDENLGMKFVGQITRRNDVLIQYYRRRYKFKPGGATKAVKPSEELDNTISHEASAAGWKDASKETKRMFATTVVTAADTDIGLSEVSLSCERSEEQSEHHMLLIAPDQNETSIRRHSTHLCVPMTSTVTHVETQMQYKIKLTEGCSEVNDSCCENSDGPDLGAIQRANDTDIVEDEIMKGVAITARISDMVIEDDCDSQCSIERGKYGITNRSSEPTNSSASCPGCHSGACEQETEKTSVEQFGMHSEVLDSLSLDKNVQQTMQRTDRDSWDQDGLTHVSPTHEITPALRECPEIPMEVHDSVNNCIMRELHVSNSTKAESRLTAKAGGKRKRELHLQNDDGFRIGGFIKSPCEGLRPRATRDASTSGTDTKQPIKKTLAAKETKKCSDDSASGKNKKEQKKVSHSCDIEGCKMTFLTKAELLLHKRNRCFVEGCGKKFNSHKYALLHQRVHDDERPLRCPWKGCKMSFKWAWARTEHLRVHTGERPYKCRVEGCGLTFRFVSDFSRHRRKTGHQVS